jgi:hypothetical protein
MNKTAIKNFAVWARNKLIADITYKASLLGVAEAGINAALPQSTRDVEFYDIGTKEPYAITGKHCASANSWRSASRKRQRNPTIKRLTAACWKKWPTPGSTA